MSTLKTKFPANHSRVIFAIILGGFLPALKSIAQFPEFPPNDVTRIMDRDQMMWQLGISFPSLPPKLEDPNAPDNSWPSDTSRPDGNWTDAEKHTITRSGFGLWNNYDDSKTGKYTPIDLLKMKNGIPVSSPEQWWGQRRPEILKDVREELWGVIPPDSILPSVTFSVVTSTGESGGSAFIQKVITGTIDISRYPQIRNVPKISATLRTPANPAKPVPVMVVIGSSRWTPIDIYWNICSQNGWGVCIFDCGVLQPDNGTGLTSFIIGLCNKGNWRKPTDWGSLAAWSWGISRLIDYFETDPDVDAASVGVTGHSRFGKATLVAMAYEPRVAIAFPSCSGSLGAKMNRRHWGQDIENSAWDQEYHWMAGNFFKWMGPLYDTSYIPRKCELMPVDAHSLLSLCAPRPVFINGGVNDTWTDAFGMYLTCVGATPVYKLLGKEGLIMADPEPQVDNAYISGDIGYRYHKEGHTDAPDWPAFFEFASKFIKVPDIGKEVLFSVEEMQQDFKQLRQTLENEHCCLYEYTSKEIFDSLFQHQYDLITSPLHPNEFYNILSPITAKIGCMHTAIWMPGGYCGSTNGHFSALLKYHKIGKFVGTPSGATYKCNAGRDTEINLDQTGMILTFGRTTFAAAVTGIDKTKPIMPEYPVEVTYNDFLKGKDVFMEKALMLIDGQKKIE